MLRLDDLWVWDSWVADDGDLYHLFFLQAPRSLGLLAPGAITFITPRQPPRQGDTVAVSLEPPGGAPQGVPTGPIVLSGKVI